MKDSKDKEHRISNLKNMINNIKEDDELSSYADIEEDDELINYLNNEDMEFSEAEIDNEFIYHPNDEKDYAVDLEENQIDEEYIIKAPKPKESDEINEVKNVDEFNDDLVGELSDNFDTVINAKIGGKPILSIVSLILGVILIGISIFVFRSRSDRVIDNVVSGETSFTFIIFLIIGILLVIYGIYRLFNIKNPIDKLTNSMDSDNDKDDEKDDTTPTPERPTPKAIPKSKIPLDKDSYKIGEFDMEEIRNSLKKPTTSKNKAKVEENTGDLPPAKEKTPKKKALTSEEIEEMEYEQVQLDSESIDDIFADVEDIDDLPIISIDSEEKNEEK